MATSTYLFDVLVRQQTQLEGLKVQLSQELDPILKAINDEIASYLVSAGVDKLSELNVAQVEELVAVVLKKVQDQLDDFVDDLSHVLREEAEHEVTFLEAALLAAVVDQTIVQSPGSDAGWRFATENPVQATGQLLDKYLASVTARAVEATEGLIRTGVAQGWSVQSFLTSVRGTRAANYNDGLLGKFRRDMLTTVNTAVQHVSVQARQSVYLANVAGGAPTPDEELRRSLSGSAPGRGFINGYRWVSVLDNRTSQICRSLDGQVFQFGNGPLPPMHPNCRSTTMPEFLESVQLRQDSTRDSMFGPVGANLTYYQWLLLQPASFQDSVLGPTRGKLLRNGGLSAEEFARLNLGRTFQPLTLDEMRRRWPQVFERAGIE